MGGDSGLRRLCVGICWWMLGRLWVMPSWCSVVVGLDIGGSFGFGC
jgi:hypothetical protein